jgi:hypothetical protein
MIDYMKTWAKTQIACKVFHMEFVQNVSYFVMMAVGLQINWSLVLLWVLLALRGVWLKENGGGVNSSMIYLL